MSTAARDRYVYVIKQKGAIQSEDVDIYIGVGKGRRMHHHLQQARSGVIHKRAGSIEKQAFLIELLRNQIEIEVLKREDGLTLEEAYAIEKRLIAQIGRRGIGTGTLLNADSGGAGGRDPLPSTRQRMSASSRARWTPEARAKMAETIRGKKLSPEHVAKVVAANLGKKRTPEARARISSALRGVPKSTDHIAKMSAANSTPEARARRAELNRTRKIRPETREKIASSLRGRKHTSEALANILTANRARAARNKQPQSKFYFST